jgi:hypothetical protein
MKNSNNILIGKPDWKRQLGRPRHRRNNNMKLDLKKIGCTVWATVT